MNSIVSKFNKGFLNLNDIGGLEIIFHRIEYIDVFYTVVFFALR